MLCLMVDMNGGVGDKVREDVTGESGVSCENEMEGEMDVSLVKGGRT